MTRLEEATLRDLRDAIGADAAVMRELFGAFFDQAPRLLKEGEDAVARGDARTLLRVAHTIKSSAAMFGAQELARICRDLEKDCATGMPGDAAARLAAIKAEYGQVKAALEAWGGSER